MTKDSGSQKIFWGCFIALVTTSMAFITRAILIDGTWQNEFGIDATKAGELFGAGLWPFAISIILFSLFIDRIGYKFSMYFSFVCYLLYAIFATIAYMTVNAAGLEGEALRAAQDTAYNYLFIGSVILGLGNGTVEAFINPVVATLYSKEKSKWLNILHAGWPGGLVLGGVITILLSGVVEQNWLIVVGLLFIPAIVYLIMLIGVEFPVNERVAAGTSYKEMLAEFGAIGAFIASWLIFSELNNALGFGLGWVVLLVISLATAVGYGLYCRSLGSPILIILVLLMMPLAATELGTDGWITGLMAEPMAAAGANPAWILVYTSLIMMILRFNVGPIVKLLGPVGLLAACSVLAIVGLYLLSFAAGLVFIFVAATIYGVGKSYFWPTMLGLVAEQSPKGGALTLNAIAGIGMLAVGILGAPYIGNVQETKAQKALEAEAPAISEVVTTEKSFVLGNYNAIDQNLVAELPADQQELVGSIQQSSNQSALQNIALLPFIMLIGYIGLFLYFKSKGGYKPVAISDH